MAGLRGQPVGIRLWRLSEFQNFHRRARFSSLKNSFYADIIKVSRQGESELTHHLSNIVVYGLVL